MRLLGLLIFFLTFLFVHPGIQAAPESSLLPNNKHGVHILFPEEIDQAAVIANGYNNQAAWGYVTIVIQSGDKNLKKWQQFMDKAKELKLIPIIRLATYPNGSYWQKPTKFDFLDWANFLRSLDWPVKQKIVVVYNEPNHSNEWGGEINPQEYANQFIWTKQALEKFAKDFLVLPAGLDLAVNNSKGTMDAFVFRQLMNQYRPNVFNELKAFASHSYPNPSFSSHPLESGQNKLNGFLLELSFFKRLGLDNLDVYITETGWSRHSLSSKQIANFYQLAYQNIWNDSRVKAVTPFILSAADGPFAQFSIINPNSNNDYLFQYLAKLPNIKGEPKIEQFSAKVAGIFVSNETKVIHKKSINIIDKPANSTVNIFKNIFKFIFWK